MKTRKKYIKEMKKKIGKTGDVIYPLHQSAKPIKIPNTFPKLEKKNVPQRRKIASGDYLGLKDDLDYTVAWSKVVDACLKVPKPKEQIQFQDLCPEGHPLREGRDDDQGEYYCATCKKEYYPSNKWNIYHDIDIVREKGIINNMWQGFNWFTQEKSYVRDD
jgi:hypothetical protein